MSFSFRAWPYPSSQKNNHILKCSKYGLIAYAINNNVSILVEDFGQFTPLLMWSPFQHQITAMEWYDASKTMDTAVPVLILSSLSGRLEIFDCRSRVSIFKMHINFSQQSNNSNITFTKANSLTHVSSYENDYVTSIAWSQFSSSTFYVGTKNGRLICFEITIGQIVKCKVEWEQFYNFEIDHICIEPQFGEVCAIASKNGSLVTIQNVNKYEDGKPPVSSPNLVSLQNKTDSIHQIKFYPTSTDFLILVTTSSSLLYSVNDCCVAPLLLLPGIQKFHLLHDTENLSLIVRDDLIEIWKSVNSEFKKLSELSLVLGPRYSNRKEILQSDMMGDKLILLTSEMWLTTVELKSSNKLFITHRIKLLDSKPLSFSYANESIIFATANGSVLISETSNSNFIAQISIENQSNHRQKVEDKNMLKNDQSNPNESIANPPILVSPKSKKTQAQSPNKESNDNREKTEKVPSISPSSSSENSSSLDLIKQLPVSKSQDLMFFMEGSRHRRQTFATKRSRVRDSIIKACASSSSLVLETNQREGEILDKSIIHTKHNQKIMFNQPLNNNENPSNSILFTGTNAQLNIPKIMANVREMRRFSLDHSEITRSDSILSNLVKERIQRMPKDSSSAIPPSHKQQQQKQTPTANSSNINEQENIANHTEINTTQQDGDEQNSTRVIPKNKFGNSCTLMWKYRISPEKVFESIEWISSTRIFVYTLAKPDRKKEDDDTIHRRHSYNSTNDSSDNFDSSNRFDLLQSYSGPSFLYMIDLKYHRFIRLFDSPRINITSITLSSNKQHFCVIINGCMAVLFKNKPQPIQIGSFTFQKNIFATFSSNYLIIIDINGEMSIITIPSKDENLKEKKKQLKMKKDNGNITCICGKKNLIYIGTSNGFILSFDLTTMKMSENYQIKASIVAFKSGPSGSFIVEDSKNIMIAITSDGETSKLPANIKFAILISPTILLIRRKKRHSIEVCQTFGQFTSSYPKSAYHCPLMMPSNRWIQSLIKEDSIDQNILINYGMPCIANVLNAQKTPNFTYEKMSFLRDLIMKTPELWKTSYRLSIFLGDFDTAHSIIAENTNKSNADDKWAINIMKSVLFNNNDKANFNEVNTEGVLFAAKSLINFGFVNDGVDILLSAGLWIDAVKLLMQLEKFQYAAIITRVYRDEKSLNIVKEVASKLFKIPNMVSYGLTMLCEVGLENIAVIELENIQKFYSSYILKMIK